MNVANRRLTGQLQRISDFLERTARRLAAGLVGVMLVCILVQIVARYLISEPPHWTEELARHAMIWAGFLGATVACRRRLDPVLVNHATIRNPALRRFARWLELGAVYVFGVPILAPFTGPFGESRYRPDNRTPLWTSSWGATRICLRCGME